MDSAVFRELVLNTRKPLVIKKSKLPWTAFDCCFRDWCLRFHSKVEGKKLQFEKGRTTHCNSSQWERFRQKESVSMKEFADEYLPDRTKSNLDWVTFSYKSIEELPPSCREGINFEFCGFPDAADISFWLGSKGAHTPCHYDSYGCNIVVQVYGSKLWLLFPPETKFNTIRVPYEESSIYCSETFYSPKDGTQFDIIKYDCYRCVLDPGDILIVPNKWWHYVECKSTALSINTWIPLIVDNDARLDECIVRYVVSKIVDSESSEESNFLLNPNEVGEMDKGVGNIQMLSFLLDVVGNMGKEQSKGCYEYHYLVESQVTSLARQLSANSVEKLPESEFDAFIKSQSERYDATANDSINKLEVVLKQTIINEICKPASIANIKKAIVEFHSNQNRK